MNPEPPYVALLHDENTYLREIHDNGTPVIGYFCTYTPVELIHAAGLHPVRISGSSRHVEEAYSLVPSFICPYMRGALEKGLNGEYDFISGIIQGYTCDAACGLVNIWEENIGGKLYYSLPLPYNDNKEARRFFRNRILDLIEKLESLGGRFSEESLRASLSLYGKLRRKLLEIYRLRSAGSLPMGAEDFLSLILAGFIIPPEQYVTILEEVISSEKKDARNGIPLFISGSIVESPGIYGLIEECGGRIVMDDLCTGYRNLVPPAGSGEDPVNELIDRYMKRSVCPARGRAVDRAPEIIDLIGRSKARGIIFLFQKFCTPHLADHPFLTAELKKNNIPSLTIEIEESMISEGQLRTRVEGFIEMMDQG